MADYIYLLENRLSAAQRNALRLAREVARARSLTIFLVGGAVRDLTSGSPVRDLDVVVQGNALKSRKDLEKAGAVVVGENEPGQALYLRLPGHVRLEFGSTLSVAFPKPGKPVLKPATILEDLRRRDFTVNAMALSLNEGSYGLLMDPLNGTADIENRHLRLVSNYGFIEDPVRMIRAARLMARLGWTMDERTQMRYETGKQEGYLSALSEFHRGYELEEIVHEEDPLRIMRGLEAEGWMQQLSPFWTSAKANTAEVERLREAQTQLEMQNIHPDNGAANFPLLTAKLSAQESATLKASFPRQGFVQEIEALDSTAKQFAAQLSAKSAALPSQAWRLITAAPPEAVLWVTYANKNAAIQAKLKAFSTEWPQARQKMPYTLMQEMRITADLPEYDDLLEKLFFELMDGKLQTAEEMKAFLEPYSPPAPPPPVNLRRMRAPKKEPKPRASKAKAAKPEEEVPVVERTEVAKEQMPEGIAIEPKAAVEKVATEKKEAVRGKSRPAAGAKVPTPAAVQAAALVPQTSHHSEKPAVAAAKKAAGVKQTAGKAATPAPSPRVAAAPVQAKSRHDAKPANIVAATKSPAGKAATKTVKPAQKAVKATLPVKKSEAKKPAVQKKSSKPAPPKKKSSAKKVASKPAAKKVIVTKTPAKKSSGKQIPAKGARKTTAPPARPAAPRKPVAKSFAKSASKGSAKAPRVKAGQGRKAATKGGRR